MNGPPVHVQLLRLAHQLETIRLMLFAGDLQAARVELKEAQRLVALLQKEVR